MKLSLKLQDDSPHNSPSLPLLKAKIPVSIFNQPFTSSLSTTASTTVNSAAATTASKDLAFSLATNFSSGPSFKLTYTPASATTKPPFSFSLKSGLGLFGSPENSPLIFSANFSLSSANPVNFTPSFFLHFRPQFGNFSLHSTTFSSNPNSSISGSQSVQATQLPPGSVSNSEFPNGLVSNEPSGWQDVRLEPSDGSGNGFTNPKPGFLKGMNAGNENGFMEKKGLILRDGRKGTFLGGVSVKANTVLPVTKRVMMNFRWGVNFPVDSDIRMPYLTVNKIAIEQVNEKPEESKNSKKNSENGNGDLELLKGMCFSMRRNLDVLEKENREMKRFIEEMRGKASANINGVGKKVISSSNEGSGEFERWKGKKNGERNGPSELKKAANNGGSSNSSDFESELQKAIKAAAAS